MVIVKAQAKEPPSSSVVVNGTYPAILSNIKTFQNAYGERIGFEFTLQGGDVDGKKVMRSTSPNLTPKSKLAEVLRGLMDMKDLEMTEGVDTDELIGTECNVLVIQSRGKNGHTYSNVEQVFR